MLFRVFFLALTVYFSASAVLAADEPMIKCPSPNGRFALRVFKDDPNNVSSYKVDLIETSTGEVVLDLENTYGNHINDAVLVWSANSKYVAYGSRDNREGETKVYFWNGSGFDEMFLPEKLPGPNIHFKKESDGVKNYGGATKPTRWLKSGELELSTDSTILTRDDGATYTGVVRFTVRFDARRHASVHAVGKTVTHVDE